MDHVLTFQYGSNMCECRLKARVRDAKFLAVARLDGYQIRFDKRSKDGSGKASLRKANSLEDVVFGVVYELSEQGKGELDSIEVGYTPKKVEVVTLSGELLEAFVYIAKSGSTDPDLKPYAWYKRFVVDGARKFNLPAQYIEKLESVEAIHDPDTIRDELERRTAC
jgi:gamma-glutamylcyclotransferase (GGCT)/AIG2-like uncharacterized protein YtfP